MLFLIIIHYEYIYFHFNFNNLFFIKVFHKVLAYFSFSVFMSMWRSREEYDSMKITNYVIQKIIMALFRLRRNIRSCSPLLAMVECSMGIGTRVAWDVSSVEQAATSAAVGRVEEKVCFKTFYLRQLY